MATDYESPSTNDGLFYNYEVIHIIYRLQRSHGILIERLKLTSEVYPVTEIKKLADKDGPLNSINRIHVLTTK